MPSTARGLLNFVPFVKHVSAQVGVHSPPTFDADGSTATIQLPSDKGVLLPGLFKVVSDYLVQWQIANTLALDAQKAYPSIRGDVEALEGAQAMKIFIEGLHIKLALSESH